MAKALFPTDLVSSLRRPFAVCGLVALSVLAGCSGDDDDDDGGTGPSADCIDEIDFSETIFDAGDAEALGFGDTESGSLSASDVESGGKFFDAWVVAIESDREVTLEVDPSEFDAVMAVFDADFNQIGDDIDNGFAGDAEEVTDDATEGCYVVVVGSFEPEETGSYTIRVD